MRHLKIEDLIVLDESGCHLNMTSTHARAIGGKRIKMPVAFRKGPKISVIGAISASSVEYGGLQSRNDNNRGSICRRYSTRAHPTTFVYSLFENSQD